MSDKYKYTGSFEDKDYLEFKAMFDRIIKDHKRKNQRLDKIIKQSDKQQLKLIELTEELNEYKTKLEEKVKEEVEKNKEQQLLMLNQSRLAQMGEIISMIAHQWKQPLNVLSILNQSMILKHSSGELDDKYINYLYENTNQQISQMSTTIDDFRNFFKPMKEKTNFSVNKMILNTINIVNPAFKKNNITIDFKNGEEMFFEGYSNELSQAIINIINNAKDALIEKEIEKKIINITLTKDNENLIINIIDNAKGIDKEVIDNIFKPYVSTKDENTGTGLGLYISKIIIEEHMHGSIFVSNVDDGAKFSIILKI